jgi:hypothetical protein
MEFNLQRRAGFCVQVSDLSLFGCDTALEEKSRRFWLRRTLWTSRFLSD